MPDMAGVLESANREWRTKQAARFASSAAPPSSAYARVPQNTDHKYSTHPSLTPSSRNIHSFISRFVFNLRLQHVH